MSGTRVAMRKFLVFLIIALFLPLLVVSQSKSLSVYNVRDYGAAGDGKTDDTKAFMDAWEAACTSSSNPVMQVPSDGTFLIHPVLFSGPCTSSSINFEIKGEIIAPEEPSEWNCGEEKCMKWIHFTKVDGLRISGGGTLHGRGQKWWKIHTRRKPAALVISNSENVKLIDLKLKDNPRMHIILQQLTTVFVSNITINAPGDSPNTDGIHVTGSKHVAILDSDISTGDDCISIVSGCADVIVKQVRCGPGHGVSIGSLGKNGEEAKVKNIHVSDVVFEGSTNGCRIKSWQGGRGYARNITFERIFSRDAGNPIIIDQFYCDRKKCTDQPSAVQIQHINFKQIFGTSKEDVAVKFKCSETVPCKNIIVEDVILLSMDMRETISECSNVFGTEQGQEMPTIPCLSEV